MSTDVPQGVQEPDARSLNQPNTPQPCRTPRPSPRRDPNRTFFPRRSPILTDFRHPVIQRIYDLRRRDSRDCRGLFYAEGLRFVSQAIQHHTTIEALVVCRRLLSSPFAQRLVREQRQRGVPVLEVTTRVAHELALVEDPQGIGAVMRQRWETLEHVTPGDELCWIALHTVRSFGNLGTILRTSDAVGGAGVILLGNEVDPYAPAAVRATMGALYSQRLVRTTLSEFDRWKQRHGCMLVGTAPTAQDDYHALDYRPPTILLMGEERKGLPAEVQALCDHLVRIPMVGGSDSLNLGVATGVMLYELFNQRRQVSTIGY